MPECHQKGDFALAGTTFPKIFSQRKLRIHAIWHGDEKHFTATTQVCSLHLLNKRGLTEVLIERILARDGVVP